MLLLMICFRVLRNGLQTCTASSPTHRRTAAAIEAVARRFPTTAVVGCHETRRITPGSVSVSVSVSVWLRKSVKLLR